MFICKISVKCTPVFIGTRNGTNHHDVNGCQESRRTYILPRYVKGMLAYSLIFKRNAMHCILAYDIRWSVSMYVCGCVCVVCVCVFIHLNASHWWASRKTFEINLSFFRHMYAIKTPFNDIFCNVVTHFLDHLFEGHRFEYWPFG